MDGSTEVGDNEDGVDFVLIDDWISSCRDDIKAIHFKESKRGKKILELLTLVSKNKKLTYLELMEKAADNKVYIFFNAVLSKATTMFIASYDSDAITKAVDYFTSL